MPAPKPIELPHAFELFMPTQCRCGNPLPTAVREDVLTEAKQKMLKWFGGANIRTEPIHGLWPLKSGELAEERNDVIRSFATDDNLEEYRDDFVAYAAELANRLTQEGILCRVDSKTLIYPSTQDPKPHRCALGSAPIKLPEPLTVDAIARAKVLQASLQRMDGLKDARDLFCNVLHYGYENEILPTRDWPEGVKQCLAPGSSPQIIADQNGFKIIYLQLAEGSLRKAHERQIVQRILKDIPNLRGLVVVSDVTQKQWNLINVKFASDRNKQSGVQLRRMRVGPDKPVRTAVERLLEVNVEKLGENATAAQLQDAHDRAFDVETVTKRFFNDVANWYFWALKHSTFPKDAPKEADGHDHVSLIRLITRLIFCWFLREKGLMPDELFDRRKLKDILEGFAPDKVSNKDSVYYRAILQNLFFATLSTEMDKRAWVREEQNFMAHSLYRFKECFQKPGTGMDLFKSIPFLNGGLFECLDKDLGENAKPRYVRIDGFSRRADSQPTVPDFLFFGPEREVNLSKEYGDKKFKSVTVRGLIDTLRHYNFTIEENTPIEQEVALDPELCGKVFENLLAAYNPETGETARKQTGSFYTPREIVNYMVDEALIASLKTKLEAVLPSAKNVEDRLRHLFAFNDESHQFSSEEADALIAAVDSLKTIDPAVGSGAFPMGLLHKLVFVLGKLDPDNARWRERQRQRAVQETDAAFKLGDKEERQRRLEDINEVFEQNKSDYGRKLYLIENCIYGVDIQSIAVQIAKMRFFISLIVDQKIDDKQANRGVRPLPNLETKFVAANSLIGIDRPEQQLLRNPDIDKKEAELRRVRERAFFARTPKQKSKCREDDTRLRSAISELLRDDGWDTTTARRLASWNPYDQNASADFFDPEWMFGITNGFDIAIANPPYVRQEAIRDLKPKLKEQGYECFDGVADLFVYFYEKSVMLLRSDGVLSVISSNKYYRAGYGEKLRGFLARELTLHQLLDFGDAPVFDAIAYASILIGSKALPEANATARAYTWQPEIPLADFAEVLATRGVQISQSELKPDGWRLESPAVLRLLEKLRRAGRPLREFVGARVSRGLTTGLNEAFVVDRATRNRLIREHKSSAEILKPYMRGKDIDRWRAEFADQFIVKIESSENKDHPWSGKSEKEAEKLFAKSYPAIHSYFQSLRSELIKRDDQGKYFWEQRSCKYWQEFEKPKVVSTKISIRPTFALESEGRYLGNTAYFFPAVTAGHFLLGLLNSNLFFTYAKKVFVEKQGGWFEVQPDGLESFPIPTVPSEKQKPVERLVERILAAKQKNSAADTNSLEREIDKQVYALYGLTPEEIEIVEASTVKM